MNLKRRILSVILAAAMLASFMSVGGYAQVETEAPADVPAEMILPVPEVPEETSVPEATEMPAATEAPEATKAPAATEAPEATETPEATESPEGTVPPEATESPEEVPLDGAASGTCGDNLTWTLENNVLTVSGTGEMVFPSIDNIPWKDYSSEIVEAVIESGVTGIGMGAFAMSGLKKITMADTVTRIEDYAFYFADELEEIVLHEGITYLGSYLFYGECAAVMTIPASVTEFGECLFVNCSNLETIIFADGCKKIPASIAQANEGIDTVVIPKSVKVIEPYAIGDEVQQVIYKGSEEDWATVLKGEGNDEWLKNLSFQDSISGSCGSQTRWTLEDGVLTVSGTGFIDNCGSAEQAPWYDYREKITSVVIKNGVTYVGNHAFEGLSALKTVSMEGSTLTDIGQYAFASCTGLESVVFSSVLRYIDSNAFDGCGKLLAVNFPDTVHTIKYQAFRDCVSLTELELPAAMSRLGQQAFKGCTGLTKVIVPVSMRAFEGGAFAGCVNIANVYYDASPANWEKILPGAGNECLYDAIIHYQYKCGVSEIIDMTMGKDEIGFYVYDYARKESVAGAVITIAGNVLTTGADGCAAVQLKAGSHNFTLTCEGYADQSITMNLEKGEIYVLSMMPHAAKPTVFAVDLYEGDSAVSANVLTERGYIREGSSVDYTLTVTGGYDGGSVSTYAFYQNNEQVFTMNAGGDSTGSITVDGDIFEKDVPIYVRAVARDGTKGSMQLTNIHVLPDTSKLSENTVGLGENIEITVDEDVPLLGGSKLAIELDDLPIYVETEDDGTVRIAINFYEVKGDANTGEGSLKNHLTRTDWQELKNAITEVPEELGDFLKMGPDKRFQVAESAEVAVQVWGYLEGNGNTGEVAGRIYLVTQVEVGETWQFFISSMPCVIELKITAEMKAGVGAVMNAKTLDEAQLEGTIEPSFEVAVGGGPGIAKVASATINGSGKLSHKRTFTAEKTTDRMEFEAKLFVKLKLLFMEYTKDFGPKKTWVIYDSEGGDALSLDGEPLLDGAMDVDNYTVAGREYLSDTSPWMGEIRTWSRARTTTQSAKLLQSSVYEDTQLEIVQAGDTVMAFFLTDDPAREDIDRTMLVYTIYDPDTDTWSQPAAVEDDGTADFYPSVFTEGERIYVVWADMKQVVGKVTEPNVEAIASGMDITMAVYEDGVFTTKTVTDDAYMDTTPVVYDGCVAWIRSESGNILGNDDSSVLCFYDGETVAELQPTANVTDIAMGTLDGTVCIALVTDGDGNYATMDDRVMTLVDGTGAVLQTVATGEVAQIAFTEDGLCWYEGGRLRCLASLGGSVEGWQSMEGIISGPWQIAEAGGKTWLLFTGNHVDEETGLTDTELYACIRENGGWGSPVRLTELGMNIQRFETYTVNGSVGVMIAVSDMSEVDGAMAETVSLCALKVIENADYALTDVECGQFVPEDGGYVLPITAMAANIGSGCGGDYTLELRQNGETVSALSCDGLAAGEAETISGAFAVNTAPVRNGEYTVVLCGGDADESNNTAEVTPGIDDLSVYIADYSISHTSHTISVTVENKGIYGAEGVLNIRSGSRKGEILLTESAYIAAGDRENFLVQFDAMDLAFDDTSTMLYFAVSGEYADCFGANDEDTFVVFRPALYLEHTEHTPVTLEAVPPTCTDWGLTEGSVCDVCGEMMVAQETIAATGHDYALTVTAPTCTTQGHTTHTCENCGDSFVDTYIPAAHAWDDGVIMVTPSLDRPGLKVYTCDRCGETIEQELVLKTASGDADMDGDVDIVDVWLVMYHTVGTGLLIEPAPQAADVNGDGVANSRDATQILRHINGLMSCLPE